MQAKLVALKEELKRRMHHPVPKQGAYLRSVVAGHVRYFGVPNNGSSISLFRMAAGWLWWRALQRRGQAHRLSWQRMQRYIDRWLPPACICHPWPAQRLAFVTQGKSRMR
jgi:hypothetical protein